MLMFSKVILAMSLLAAGTSAFGATYQMRRISVSDGAAYTSRCHFSPGLVKHIVKIGSLRTEQDVILKTDDEAIQALVDAAPGIQAPSFDDLTKSYTNWWVRSSPTAAFKLIRSNTSNNPNGALIQDQSDAGQKLAVYMGINCFRTFGQ